MPVTTKTNFNDARIQEGLDRLLQKAQTEVVISGAAAMARVIYDAVKANTATMRATGTLDRSIYRTLSADRSDPDKAVYHVSWNKRTAPHGHLLEFGTSRMPAKPFIRPAMAQLPEASRAATDAMKRKLNL
jgi:HK97 gp10 family phage protein